MYKYVFVIFETILLETSNQSNGAKPKSLMSRDIFYVMVIGIILSLAIAFVFIAAQWKIYSKAQKPG